MRVTVLGGCGAWPTAGQACSGFLVEHDGFRLLVDAGYAVLPRLQEYLPVEALDAVYISHRHPDHCADLNPLLRARALRDDDPLPPLPVYAPAGALDAVLALDRPGMLDHAYRWHAFEPGDNVHIGPFDGRTLRLPHTVPDAGIRLAAGGQVVAYTGDTGPSADIVLLAREADLFIAEASVVMGLDPAMAPFALTAAQAGAYAAAADAGRLLLTHLYPGTDPGEARQAASEHYGGPLDIAMPGLVVDLNRPTP